MRRALKQQGHDAAEQAQALMDSQDAEKSGGSPRHARPARLVFGAGAGSATQVGAALRGDAQRNDAVGGSESSESSDEDEDATAAAARRSNVQTAGAFDATMDTAAPAAAPPASVQRRGKQSAMHGAAVRTAPSQQLRASASEQAAAQVDKALLGRIQPHAAQAEPAPNSSAQSETTLQPAAQAAAPQHKANGSIDTAAALAEAFAGDDVVADFEKDKGEAAQESVGAVEDPKALPGWGTWAHTKREPRCASLADTWTQALLHILMNYAA